jgi:hypothetical protein
MTKTEILQVIKNRLGQRPNIDDQIELELVTGQEALERGPTLFWFLVGSDSTLVTVADNNLLTLPSDYIRVYHDGGLWVTDTGDDSLEKQLKKDDYRTLKKAVRDGDLDASGLPTHYAEVGQLVYLFPTPDIVYSMELFYYGKQPTLGAGSDEETLWSQNAADLLLARAGGNVARYLRDMQAAQLFLEDERAAMRNLLVEDTARREAGLEAVMGG